MPRHNFTPLHASKTKIVCRICGPERPKILRQCYREHLQNAHEDTSGNLREWGQSALSFGCGPKINKIIDEEENNLLLDESVESVESESEEKVRETIEKDQLRGDENKNSSGETSNKSEEADLRRSSTESESSPRKVVQWEERT